ncbi:MAG: Hsp33 family molecular chaperone HslO [Candidatus Sericytochromatia bacterium]|nr:Hsp33 family molecular chaperone HslO [Candidatus Tanganyikabacteria bacterium]
MEGDASRRDTLIRMTAGDGRIRAVAALTTQTVDEARARHQTSPIATAALGKALTGGLLLSAALMKDGGRLTVRVLGQGPLGGIIVDAGFDGSVRGYVARPDLQLPVTAQGTLDIGGAVGREGFLYVTHDSGLGHPYTGVVELVSGELGEDFTHYLATSEQIPAAVSLGIYVEADGRVSSAGGLLVQLLPGAGDEIAWRLEQNIRALPGFTTLARKWGTPEEIARAALTGFQSEILSSQAIAFSCQCSSERVLTAIASLGQKEIRAMLDEDGKAEVRCHFCNEEYVVSGAQLAEMLEAS